MTHLGLAVPVAPMYLSVDPCPEFSVQPAPGLSSDDGWLFFSSLDISLLSKYWVRSRNNRETSMTITQFDLATIVASASSLSERLSNQLFEVDTSQINAQRLGDERLDR